MQVDRDKLREIGWKHWDPIELSRRDGDWRGRKFEDEYDFYLQTVSVRLQYGATLEEVSEYLANVVAFDMGMGRNDQSEQRALTTAKAILTLVRPNSSDEACPPTSSLI